MIRLGEKNTWIGFGLIAFAAYETAIGNYIIAVPNFLAGFGLVFSLGTEQN